MLIAQHMSHFALTTSIGLGQLSLLITSVNEPLYEHNPIYVGCRSVCFAYISTTANSQYAAQSNTLVSMFKSKIKSKAIEQNYFNEPSLKRWVAYSIVKIVIGLALLYALSCCTFRRQIINNRTMIISLQTNYPMVQILQYRLSIQTKELSV